MTRHSPMIYRSKSIKTMAKKKIYKYQGREYVEVPSPAPVCDGCIFEFHEIGKDCSNIGHPECVGKFREDGQDVVFRYRNAKVKQPKQNSNGKDTGTSAGTRGKRRSKD